MYAQTHHSNVEKVIESANSIAQSMLYETLTIENDIDVFKLILSLFISHIRLQFFFLVVFAALPCNTSTI